MTVLSVGAGRPGDRLNPGSDHPPFPHQIEIQANDLHIVRFRLDEPVEGALDLLDDGERNRAARFVFPADRDRFITAHAWLRITLSRCVNGDPRSLRFVTGPHGKPRLAETPIDLRYNLSHSAERALLAITIAHDAGIDIERERPIETLELARRFFAAAESDTLRALPPADRVPAFFRCWTRKEAFIKALGDGLAFPLDGFEVSLADIDASQLLRACSANPSILDHWRILSVPAESGYAAAVATDIDEVGLRLWNAPIWARP